MSAAAATHAPADLEQRLQALDVGRSFIVQAPAGSGKTGLLTQRYLALLSIVEHPEEIVAITFTRKAAAEMRARILDALRASREPKPDDDYQQRTWRLARAALAHSDELGWNVLDDPQRLRIRTIDSLCQLIGRQMPVQSGFGEAAGVVEDAAYLHRAAAERTLAELESGGGSAGALVTLLQALDNRMDTLAGLISAMLARRDQWLQHVLQHGTRADTEQVLVTVIEQHLFRLADGWDPKLTRRLLPLLRFAAGNLPAGHALAWFTEAMALPDTSVDQLPAWQALAELFLTRQGAWRARLNKNQGFPADKKSPAREMKADALALLDELRDHEALRILLAGLARLPSPAYADEEWALVEALFVVLKQSVGHLRLVFAEQGQVDFTELSLRALEALGDELEPTELALKLDYRLRHLLVDEFQDTSQIQNQLFRRLTAGWQPGDGRTLFLVGDPMQSIYRFREADVGQFLDAWQGRLGGIELLPLRLAVNFRSDEGVIDWVNRVFPEVLPENDDKERGAVRYASSEPYRTAGLEQPVRIHAYLGREDTAEAARMLELIDTACRRGGTTAVLARSKAHLAELVEQLRSAGKRFQAVEIGALQHSPAVMDLASLTRALLHCGDRVAWLAVLHGPYCGLSLPDLLVLASERREGHGRTLLEALLDRSCRQGLSEDGQSRLARFVPVLEQVLAERGRRPLHEWVESAWLALGGPLTLGSSAAREDAEVYFQLLLRLARDGRAVTPERLDEEVQRLCAPPDPEADGSLQLMSIHKAKGLEFDAVILPGLGGSLSCFSGQPGTARKKTTRPSASTSGKWKWNRLATRPAACYTSQRHGRGASCTCWDTPQRTSGERCCPRPAACWRCCGRRCTRPGKAWKKPKARERKSRADRWKSGAARYRWVGHCRSRRPAFPPGSQTQRRWPGKSPSSGRARWRGPWAPWCIACCSMAWNPGTCFPTPMVPNPGSWRSGARSSRRGSQQTAGAHGYCRPGMRSQPVNCR
jgi:ATP-dependent exoDNAse (exonuclease V) beta subunit